MPLFFKEMDRTLFPGRVKPIIAFARKKDAENHVALIAIKTLKEKGLLDEYFYPFLKNKKKATGIS